MKKESNVKEKEVKAPKKTIDKVIFGPPLILSLLVAIFVGARPEKAGDITNQIFAFLTETFGWLYLWVTFGIFAIILYISFSKIGKIKLGKEDEKPEFSTFSWVGMIFTAATGVGLVYWGTIEWAYYYSGPSFGAEPLSWQAAEQAAAYGMFHWGFHAWAIYAIAAIPIAYIYHVKRKPIMKISEACRGLLGDKVDGIIGQIIDVFFVFGLIAGAGTSMGLGTPMVAAGVSKLTGIPTGFGLDLAIIIIWTIIIALSLTVGLQKGLRKVSDFNLYLTFGLIGFLFIAGPTVFILDTFSSAQGFIMDNFFRMSLWTDSILGEGFPQSWVVFYWAWWFVYAPTMGLFLAKISKGRTVRELAAGAVLGGSFGSWVFYSVLGNFALDLQLQGTLMSTELLAEIGPAATIIEIFSAAPMGSILMPGFVLLGFIGLVTGQNSLAYTLAMTATKNIPRDEDPARWNRIFWAILLSLVSATLLYIGGLRPLQTISIIAGFPLMFVLVIMIWSFFKNLQEDQFFINE